MKTGDGVWCPVSLAADSGNDDEDLHPSASTLASPSSGKMKQSARVGVSLDVPQRRTVSGSLSRFAARWSWVPRAWAASGASGSGAVVEIDTRARRAATAVMDSVEKGCILFVSHLSFLGMFCCEVRC